MHNHIIITAAVYEELSALIDRVEKPVVSKVGGRKIVSGHIEGKSVKLLVTGPGLVNTVQALTAAIEDSRPSLIIQTGCAGAFKESGLKIGDIGIATEEIDVNLGIEPENGDGPLTELPFSLLDSHGSDIKNRYSLDHELANLAFKAIKKGCADKNIGLIKGSFITVSTITATDARAEKLYKQYKPCMENMEGSGAACLSLHYDIPFLEIRSVSNIVGKRDLTAWNLPLAFERGAIAVFDFVFFTTKLTKNTKKL
ncbi:MAG: futalosine hydrolase [Desulfobacterales bacterium]|uniref:Futalosine hydrolase n=1 Tax=Candidatus Desulfaltia bathyphila TaxID=2841697 RepID=A0A8J6TCB6_9BACT|nr:futalosine hydrolase [Candidatus Desulfaltia bathyphila]MBL7207628.1 futalosine hydrolase [Desulfobacterales bacterium]